MGVMSAVFSTNVYQGSNAPGASGLLRQNTGLGEKFLHSPASDCT